MSSFNTWAPAGMRATCTSIRIPMPGVLPPPAGLPQDLPWNDRPVVKSGTVLAEVGDTGTNVGAFHLHFCVTTKPDRKEFAPFESVPIAFRNYSFSLNEGKTWTFVAVGVPKQGQWVSRETRPGPSAPLINAAASVLNFGVVKGQISSSVAPPGVAGGKLTLKIESQWGEPLAQQTIAVPGGSAGPWNYEFANVPAFNNMKVAVSSEGAWNTIGGVAGEKGPFELKPGTVATVNIQLEDHQTRMNLLGDDNGRLARELTNHYCFGVRSRLACPSPEGKVALLDLFAVLLAPATTWVLSVGPFEFGAGNGCWGECSDDTCSGMQCMVRASPVAQRLVPVSAPGQNRKNSK